MEQITIKQKLDAIVCAEILGLKKVLDEWFSSVKNTDELILARDKCLTSQRQSIQIPID